MSGTPPIGLEDIVGARGNSASGYEIARDARAIKFKEVV